MTFRCPLGTAGSLEVCERSVLKKHIGPAMLQLYAIRKKEKHRLMVKQNSTIARLRLVHPGKLT